MAKGKKDYIVVVAKAEHEPIMVYARPGKPHRLKNHYMIEYYNSGDSNDFTWGYYGTGPHATAYSILRELFGKEVAEKHHERFVDLCISKLKPEEGFTLFSFEVSRLLGISRTDPK